MALAVAFTVNIAGAAPSVHDGFYDQHERGWFWYEPLPEKIKPEKKKKPKPNIVQIQPAPTPEQTSKAQEPKPLSAEWLSVNLPKYRRRALDTPSDTNVRAYMYLQRVSIDKADKFAAVSQRVVQGNRVLDEYAQYPQGTSFVQAMQQDATNFRDNILRDMAKDTGLIFFFESKCPYCRLEVKVLKTMQRLYGIDIVPVSLDNKPLPGNPFPDFRNANGVGEHLGITSTPTIVLAHPPDGMQVIAHGLLSLEELKSRMLSVAAQRGWINPAAYERTKPSNQHVISLADLEITPEQAEDPDLLVEAIKARTP